jgi:hypothetical protein
VTLTFDEQTQRKQRFIRAVAEYLVIDQAHQSILLSLGDEAARRWARIRTETPLHGYVDVHEAERVLGEFLGVPMPEHS